MGILLLTAGALAALAVVYWLGLDDDSGKGGPEAGQEGDRPA